MEKSTPDHKSFTYNILNKKMQQESQYYNDIRQRYGKESGKSKELVAAYGFLQNWVKFKHDDQKTAYNGMIMKGVLIKRGSHKLFQKNYKRYFEIDFSAATLTIKNESWIKNGLSNRDSV